MRNALILCTLALLMGCAAESDDAEEASLEIDSTATADTSESSDALTGSWDTAAEAVEYWNINAHRGRIGRGNLARRQCLDNIARVWTVKLASENRLSHNPNLGAHVTGNCTGVRWKMLGENVGYGQTEASIWQAFLASPGHRANIETARFDSLGVAVYRRSDGRRFITQIFADF